MEQTCDFSPLKLELKERLLGLVDKMQVAIAELEEDKQCLLNEFQQISAELATTESMAAAFYLKCYLSAYTDKYADISLCVRRLSERRHGALIVVERSDSLDDWVTAGIPVGAELSPALLESVFVPGAPLHDGAVRIKHNKIVSAANVLPLSALATEKKLGMRHRAAIGITERCDALSIVVSEETGKASFCLNGQLYAFALG
ncbi:sporulation-specific diadenylate cyclase CdaS [Paenibacillus allorhizosphaerae]|uniref:Diadenylate cyclase CdaS n=1 Tax=Paenibacillus allorhizosphaerae TaxID=2849866 RepID=A0ABM8VFX4_9BACL|nr:sporulation-specific diadenylate cyclase CdaS [Paenibacillus allorhizosphaerae]CAG7636269.1 Diadenylate cyclase CdaS [Paenibacillus allorhizosphaerae]